MQLPCINLSKSARSLLLVSLLAGCALSTTPELDAVHGDAVRSIKAAQTLNPKAPSGNDPVTGIDGKSAAHAQERYQDSFKSPPRTFDINTSPIGQ